jgi:membrane protein
MAVADRFGGLSWKELSRRSWSQFLEDRIPDQSAMLSFYLLLSIFPLLLLLIDLLGLLFQSEPGFHLAVHKYFARIAPSPASGLIDKTLSEAAIAPDLGPVRLSLKLLFTWLPASQGVMAVIEGLNIAYGVSERRRWWQRYLSAYGLTIVSILLLASGLVFLIMGGHVSEVLGNRLGYSGFIAMLWQILDWVFFISFVLLAFNILYIYGPAVKHRRWRWMMPGTIVAVVLWLIVSFGFKIYLHFMNYYSSTYGSIGAVIILMMWFYFFGISILVGAEVNSEIEKAAGTVAPPQRAFVAKAGKPEAG